MTVNDQQRRKQKWHAPEIIEIGAVVDLTTNDPQYKLRDNQGSTPVAYKVFTVTPWDEVDPDSQ